MDTIEELIAELTAAVEEEPKEKNQLEKLIQEEQELGARLTHLSKNATKNKPMLQSVMNRMNALKGEIGQAEAGLQAETQRRQRPRVQELQANQEKINLEIARLSKQPSKYSARIQELGKASKEIDSQIEAVRNE